MDVCPAASFEFSARYHDAADLADRVLTVMPSDLRTDTTRIALVEALANAVLHGGYGLSGSLRDADDLMGWLDLLDQTEQRLPPADVRVRVLRPTDARCCVEVTQPGDGFDWQHAPVRRGRGLGILREICSDLTWNAAGNTVRMTFALPAPTDPETLP